jgi:hypothetical protein
MVLGGGSFFEFLARIFSVAGSQSRIAMSTQRQLLLALLSPPDASGVRRCQQCPNTTFSANSDSAAWKKHVQKFHRSDWNRIVATLQPPAAGPAAAAASAPGPSDVESVSDASVLSSPPVSKKRKKSPTSASSTSTTTQAKITTLFGTAHTKHAVAALARLCAQSSIAHNVLDSPEFKQFLDCLGWNSAHPTRESLRSSILELASDLRDQLVSRLHSAPLTVAADGWTNVRHEKVTNVVLCSQGVAYYWCSIVNATERNDAVWLSEQLIAVIRTLMTEHKLQITALVVDNEAVNKAAFNRMKVAFPFLIHIPCAAHTVQLAVRSCLALPAFAPTVAQISALIAFFSVKENRQELKRVQAFRGSKSLVVLKPCDTRWSSMHIAAERLLFMRRDIECCNVESVLPSKDAFFAALEALCKFLKPFHNATDAIQSDKATLLTVYEQFTTLLAHAHDTNSGAAEHVLERWQKHINVPATVAVAWCSFAAIPPSLNEAAARDFIVEFGADFLLAYCPGKATREQICDDLTRQIAEVNAQCGRFGNLNRDRVSIERGGWCPLLLWALYKQHTLSTIARVLLSLSASEASVERTFSAQGAVHTKNRNRLANPVVQAEMFLKFNQRVMQQRREDPSPPALGVVEMDDAYDSDDCVTLADHFQAAGVSSGEDEEEDAEFPVAPAEEQKDEPMEEESDESANEEAAAAVAASANSRRIRRQPSARFPTLADFTAWFIREYHITPATTWNADLRNLLTARCSRAPLPCPNTQSLEQLIRAELRL